MKIIYFIDRDGTTFSTPTYKQLDRQLKLDYSVGESGHQLLHPDKLRVKLKKDTLNKKVAILFNDGAIIRHAALIDGEKMLGLLDNEPVLSTRTSWEIGAQMILDNLKKKRG